MGAYVGNLVDLLFSPRSELVQLKHKVFATAYGWCVGYLLFVYGYNLANYELGKPPALGSGILTQVSDILWIVCVCSVTSFLPHEQPLHDDITVSQTLHTPLERVETLDK